MGSRHQHANVNLISIFIIKFNMWAEKIVGSHINGTTMIKSM